MGVYYIHEKISSSPKGEVSQRPLPDLADPTWFGSFIQGMRDVAAVLTGLLLFLLIIGSVPLAFSLVMLCFK